MNARLPAWDDLHVFLATARGGTLAAAARVLGVNASTVHRRIARLEDDLSIRVFERSQRGYALTSAGEELMRHALAIEQEVLAVGRKVGGMDQSLEGLIRVATVDDLALEMLTPIIVGFRRLHPNVGVQVELTSDFADLSRREADVALRFGRRPREPDIVVKHVTRVEVALYASTEYLRRNGRPRAPEDLKDHDVVCGVESMKNVPMERFIHRYAKRIAHRSNSMLTRIWAIRQGLGLGFLGCFFAGSYPELELIELETPDLLSDLWMLIHVDLRRNARVRAFVDFSYEALCARRSEFTRT